MGADSRISFDGSDPNDWGIKTYELGGACAMVASGDALPPLIAADLTRSIVENHNRTSDEKLSFFNTVKLFSFFVRRVARGQDAACRIAAAGFLERGEPCIANIVVSRKVNRTHFKKLGSEQTTAIPVGDPSAYPLLLGAMSRAKQQNRPAIATAFSMLYYISKNAGVFKSVGGGLSFGGCKAPESNMSWPIIEIDGKRFLRGIDVTAAYRKNWPPPEKVPYDETWCAELDHEIASKPAPELKKLGSLPGYDIDVAITEESLFSTADEPPMTMIGDEA